MAKRRRKFWQTIANLFSVLLIVGAVGAGVFVYLRWLWREQRYNQLIEQVAATEGVDKFLIKAVMRQESGFDPFARSSKGAVGLMQVMPDTGKQWARANKRSDFTPESLWKETINIQAGTWYLGRALRYWQTFVMDDPVPFALAEYNAGRGNVLHWLPKGKATTAEEFKAAVTFPSVRHYIERVTEFQEDYKAAGRL